MPTPAVTATGKWFAAYTMARHEKQVATQCERLGIAHFLPLHVVHRSWKNRTQVDVHLPLFPNYIFARLSPGEHTALLRLGGVVCMVGNASGSTEIPEEEINTLRQVVRSNTVAPHTGMQIGDPVRIKRGPLQGVIGHVLRSRNGWRFVLTLGLIGKSVCVDVDAVDLEPALLEPARLQPALSIPPSTPASNPGRSHAVCAKQSRS